jgi:hypothetical protein
MVLVVAGGDYLQTWRIAMNILNKQSWTADKERSSTSVAGWEANNASLQKKNKKKVSYEMLHRVTDFDLFDFRSCSSLNNLYWLLLEVK